MKKFLIAAAILATTISAAEAKCSRASVGGNWRIAWGGLSTVLIANLNNGIVQIPLIPASGTYTMSQNCMGTLQLSGVPILFTLVAEHVDPGSSLKPNHMDMTYDNGAGAGYFFPMARQ